MSANLKHLQHRYTIDEYFALARGSERRYEYWDGEIVCMSGGSKNHSLIAINLSASITRQVTKCSVIPADIPILTPNLPPFRYADLSVACPEPILDEISGVGVLVNPIATFEILSHSSELIDKNAKRDSYLQMHSLRDYLVIAQDMPHVIHQTKAG